MPDAAAAGPDVPPVPAQPAGHATAGATGLAIGLDIGGTKIAAGLVAGDGSVLRRLRLETPRRDESAFLEALLDAITALGPGGREWSGGSVPRPPPAEDERGMLASGPGAGEASPLPVGVGIASLVDRDGRARYGPNIVLGDYPLGAALADRLRRPVVVDNDANVAGWGEFVAGAGRDVRHAMLLLTLGTGVGGAVVSDGRLLRGANGFAGHLGHIIIAEGGAVGPSGIAGELEAYASGTAIGLLGGQAVAEGRAAREALAGPDGRITGKSVTTAAHAGDEVARGVLAVCGGWLGVGIASLVNALDPEIVVVGGGAMQAGELLLEPARAAFRQRFFGAAVRPEPPIVRAQLADDAGMIGAALLALGAPARS